MGEFIKVTGGKYREHFIKTQKKKILCVVTLQIVGLSANLSSYSSAYCHRHFSASVGIMHFILVSLIV